MTETSLTVDGHKVSIRNDINTQSYNVSEIQTLALKNRTEVQGHVSLNPGDELTIRIESTTGFQYRKQEKGLLVGIHMQGTFLGSWFIPRKYKRTKHDIKIHVLDPRVKTMLPPNKFAFLDLSPDEACKITCQKPSLRRGCSSSRWYKSQKNELIVSIERGFTSKEPCSSTAILQRLTSKQFEAMFPDEPCFQIIGQYFRPTQSASGLPRLFAFKNKLPSCTLANCLQKSGIDDQDPGAESQITSHEQVAGIPVPEPGAVQALSAPSVTSPASTLTEATPANHQDQQDTTHQGLVHSSHDPLLIFKSDPAEEPLPKRSRTREQSLPIDHQHGGAFQGQQNEFYPTGPDHGPISQGHPSQRFQQDRFTYNWADYKPLTPMTNSGFSGLPNNASEEDSYELQMASSRYRQQQAKVEEERAKVEQEKALQHLLATRRNENQIPRTPAR